MAASRNDRTYVHPLEGGGQPRPTNLLRIVKSFPPPLIEEATPLDRRHKRDFSEEARTFSKRTLGAKSTPRAKVIVLGDAGVGKTSLLRRFCDNVYDPGYKATIGVDFDTQTFEILGSQFTLQLWDTAGNERFRTVTRAYYRGAQAVILAFDMSEMATLDSMKSWSEEANDYCNSEFDVYLVGCKADILSQRHYKDIEAMAKAVSLTLNAEFWPTSSATGENVDRFFERVSCVAYERVANIDSSSQVQSQVSIGNNLVPLKQNDSKHQKNQKRQCC